MRGDSEFVQAVKLFDKNSNPILEIEGTFVEGETMTYELAEGEKIIGIYGIYNYQPYVVGFGFIIWTPKKKFDTDNNAGTDWLKSSKSLFLQIGYIFL